MIDIVTHWKVEACLVETRLEKRLNEIEGEGGAVVQVLASANPMNVYIIWKDSGDAKPSKK